MLTDALHLLCVYIFSAHIGADGARVQYITRALRAPVVQRSLQQFTVYLALILSCKWGAQYTKLFVYYATGTFVVATVRDTISRVVTGHVITTRAVLH